MGHGKKLSDTEIRRIIELKSQNLTVSKISNIAEKSCKVIYNFLNDLANYGKKNSYGRPSTLSKREKGPLYVSPR